MRGSSEDATSAPVSPSRRQAPLLPSSGISVTSLLTGRQHLGLRGIEPGAFLGDASGAKGEKGVSTKPAVLVYSYPNTMGDRARPALCPCQGPGL